MLKAERHRVILESLERDGKLVVTRLCQHLDVSEMTIRRDLQELEQSGHLRRVHGGAIRDLGRSYEPPYRLRSANLIEHKERIAAKAAELVLDGDSIALDIGTTTYAMIPYLKDRKNLTIVSASLRIAYAIATQFKLESDVRLIVTGGIVRAGELSMIGSLAEYTYDNFNLDKAFVGVGGIHLDRGLSEYNIEDNQVKKSLIASAKECIVLADHSKLNHVALAHVADLKDVSSIVTDRPLSIAYAKQLAKVGIKVYIG
jgi:DeoR/GlpR family transcriptional regulator of sugar metabolism